MDPSQTLARIVIVGIGATAVMDAWLALLRRLGVRTLDFALLGRWAGHLLRGRFAHAAIAKAAPVRGERLWGWLVHYGVGIAFAGLPVLVLGSTWLREPSLVAALAIGIATVVAPLFVLQPAMGAGFAGSRTPAPLANGLRSMANHAVFGLGLYLSAVAVAWIAR